MQKKSHIAVTIFHCAICIFTITLVNTSKCEEKIDEKRVDFPAWAFCVVYQFRDEDKRDVRPVTPKIKEDAPIENPFDDEIGESLHQRSHSLLTDYGLDVAALSTRAVKSSILKKEVSDRVLGSVYSSENQYPQADCYEPHHIFVFFDDKGQQVAAIELCFACNRATIMPKLANEKLDFLKLAKIVTDAGLGLHSFDSYEAYEKHLHNGLRRTKDLIESLKGK